MDDKQLNQLRRAMDRVPDNELLPGMLDHIRETQINIRVSKAQKKQLQALTKSLKISMSDYLMTLHALALPRLKAAVKAKKK